VSQDGEAGGRGRWTFNHEDVLTVVYRLFGLMILENRHQHDKNLYNGIPAAKYAINHVFLMIG